MASIRDPLESVINLAIVLILPIVTTKSDLSTAAAIQKQRSPPERLLQDNVAFANLSDLRRNRSFQEWDFP